MDQISGISQISRDLGNTKPSPKSKKVIRARRWCIVWNNYTQEELVKLKIYCDFNCKYFVLGEEIAPTTGTPHIQGYLEFKNQKVFSVLKKEWPKMNLQIAKGSRSQNLTYCSKDGKVQKSMNFQEKICARLLATYDKVTWQPWQQDVLDYIETEPNDREIYWIYEDEGNVGKSFLAKYIVLKYDCIIANGKKDNIFNQIKTSLDNEKEPKIILLDIPRHNMEYLNYGCLEQLKNGMLYSGKYEGGKCMFGNPHVIVFANTEPAKHKMSEDRWKIVELKSL